MRTYRSQKGPFQEGLFFSKEEIERICVDELRSVGLLPTTPQEIDIDRFVEKRFVTPRYEDLGEGILGLTKFGKNGVQEIVVNSRMEEESTRSAERRVRSTLAHEAGHGLLHTHLFVLANLQNPLFDGEGGTPKVLCRDEKDVASQKSYNGKWWEFQANRAIGSFLLPTHLFQQVLEPFMVSSGGLGLKMFDESKRESAERELAEVFNVNPRVARIRIEEFYSRSEALQGML